MPRSRPDRTGVPGLLAAALILATSACASLPALGGSDFRNHPAALVGEWIDSVKTTPADTALWVLGPAGEDGTRHRTADGAGRVVHYGYWYLHGTIDTVTDRTLCFTNRPGRSAATCRAFDLDSVVSPSGTRRRLVVHGYQGAHSIRDRVLLGYSPAHP